MASPSSQQSVLLNNGSTATIFPIWEGSQLPLELVAAMCVEYNAEIDRGQSFPETHRLVLETFEKSWFSGVSGVVISGSSNVQSSQDFDLLDANDCLGSFCIMPCYPGRSSHICTANFSVRSKYRRRGVGMAMAQCFLRWASQLGYDYALFNLVYDCNVGACKILNKLDFSIMTVLKGAGILKGFSYPVDAFIFGRPLLSQQSIASPYATPNRLSKRQRSEPMHQPESPLQNTPPHGSDLELPSRDGDPINNNQMVPNGSPNPSIRTVNIQNGTDIVDKRSEPNRHNALKETYELGQQKIDQQDFGPQDRQDQRKDPRNDQNNTRGTPTPRINHSVDTPNIHAETVSETVPNSPSSKRTARKHNLEFQNLFTYIVEGRYPTGLSRTERTRIRSRGRSYYVKDGVSRYKRSGMPVVSDPEEQVAIATHFHEQNHNGINKLLKLILNKYYWQGVRETISKVIKSCTVCNNNNSNNGHKLDNETSTENDQSHSPSPPVPVVMTPLDSDANQFNSTPNNVSYYTPPRRNEPQDPGSVVYLLPEDEDADYIPSDEAYDMGLGGEHDEYLEEEEDVFKDDDDGEWVSDDEDEDDDDDDERAEDEEELEQSDHASSSGS